MSERGKGRGGGRGRGGEWHVKGNETLDGFWGPPVNQNSRGRGRGGRGGRGGAGGGGNNMWEGGRGRGGGGEGGNGVWEGGGKGRGGGGRGNGVWGGGGGREGGGGGGRGRGVLDGEGRGGFWEGVKDRGKKAENRTEIKEEAKSGERRFEAACREIQAGVERYMATHGVVDDDGEEDEDDEDDLEEDRIMERVYGSYGEGEGGRTEQYLQEAFRTGALICLICIDNVKRTHSIWSCGECYNSFHLHCVQKWAKDSLFQLSQAMAASGEQTSDFDKASLKWCCPKCRKEYAQWNIPSKYTCFCGRLTDPEFDPWLPPHSCGNTCGRALRPDCGHSCLLLCHPGPCPPCPKTVNQKCHCGQKAAKTVRCSAKEWSCSGRCPNTLSCNAHPCPDTCHPAPCPPCSRQSSQSCACGSKKKLRDCAAPQWHCDKVCGKPFSCRNHTCERVCHEGACGDCPRGGVRTCNCGKSTYDLPCTQDVPGCGDTCGKMLACGEHRCAERCHRGECPTCLQFRVKMCRCGARKKEVACSRDFTCETKCKRLRDCGRHTCNKKCCVGECGRCEQPCGRGLGCGSHRCESRCHPGPCYPCSATHTISCRCGASSITLPCGRHRNAKPPRCSRRCKIPSDCHHPTREPHKCHQGSCPTCKQICELVLSCSHTCPAACHDNVPIKVVDKKKRAGPWEPVVAPHFEIKRLPCPPCQVPIPTTCLGGHETPDLPCSEAKVSSCGRVCGRALSCTHHTCQIECHKVEGATNDTSSGTNCGKCEVPCTQSRPPGCSHSCPKPCHPGPCSLCPTLVKVKCHCAITQLYKPCNEITSAEGEAKESLLCCGNQCSKTMDCGHRCPLDCHSGACGGRGPCQKRTAVRCPCKRIKKDHPCNLFVSGSVKVECDAVCLQKISERKKAAEEEARKKKEEEERQQKKELEEFERKMEGRRGRRRNRKHVDEVVVNDRGLLWKGIAGISVAVVAIGTAWALEYI